MESMPDETNKLEAVFDKSASLKEKLRLGIPRPVLKDWRFWTAQVIVVILAGAHSLFELAGVAESLGNFYFLPLSLFWVPVTYVALTFGFSSAIITGLWVVIVSIPNFVFWHEGPARLLEIVDVAIIAVMAVLVGYLVEQMKTANEMARLYAFHALRSHEEERLKISRELHDDIIQAMIGVCRQLDGIKYLSKNLPESVGRELSEVRGSVEDIVGNLRNFTSAIRPPVLDGFGVIASVRRLLKNIAEQTGVDTELKVDGEEIRLAADREASMFRIVQEALRNVEYHSQATRVTIAISFSDKDITFDIHDNGIGFQVPQASGYFASSGRFGLLGIYEYTELLGGRLEVESKPGKGSRITAVIPLSQDNQTRFFTGMSPYFHELK